MSNVFRSIAWIVIAVILVVVLTVFIRFLLEIALLTALVAFAYYWFTRASAMRRRDR